MEILTVSFFGHRDLYDTRKIDSFLPPIIDDLLRNNYYVSFLIGRNGDFDIYTASLLKALQRPFGKERSELTLVLPYAVKDLEYYADYYDNVIIPDELHGAHPKAAITLKNRWMVERSDLVIVNVERENGGAYTAMKYAEKMQKRVINIVTL